MSRRRGKGGGESGGFTYTEQMAENRPADMQGDAAEVDSQQHDPLEIIKQRAENILVAVAEAEHGQRDVAEPVEDDDDSEVDLKGVDVVVVEVAIEPAHGGIVDQRQDPGRADGVVGADVGHDGDFGGQGACWSG